MARLRLFDADEWVTASVERLAPLTSLVRAALAGGGVVGGAAPPDLPPAVSPTRLSGDSLEVAALGSLAFAAVGGRCRCRRDARAYALARRGLTDGGGSGGAESIMACSWQFW